MLCRPAPARRSPTRSSTSTGASACCSATPAGPGGSCRTTRCTSRGRSRRCARGGTFVGQHVLTPLRGVAVQVNAFDFPGLGPSGEVRARVHRRRAQPGEAGHPDGLPDRPAGRADDRIRAAPRGLAAAGLRRHRRPVRAPDRAGPGVVHRVGGDRAQAARASHRGRPGGPVQRRGRLAELLDPGAGRHGGHARGSTCTCASWSAR